MTRTLITGLFGVIFLVLGFKSVTAATPPADTGGPLDAILKKVTATVAVPKTAVVIFDLDETLFRVSDRTRCILKDWSVHLPSTHAELRQKIDELDPEEMPGDLTAVLEKAGITDPALARSARRFWGLFYYTNRYLLDDEVIPGAVPFLRALHDAGAQIAYVSGRDERRVSWGTKAALKKYGLPRPGEDVQLLLKTNRKMNDLDFKAQKLPALHALGEVCAIFVHDPAEAELFAKSFPAAAVIVVDRTRTVRAANRLVIADYLRPKRRTGEANAGR